GSNIPINSGSSMTITFQLTASNTGGTYADGALNVNVATPAATASAAAGSAPVNVVTATVTSTATQTSTPTVTSTVTVSPTVTVTPSTCTDDEATTIIGDNLAKNSGAYF